MEMTFKVGELVRCTVFRPIPDASGKLDPQFSSHIGEVLAILPDGRYEVWGPGGEQSQKVSVDCLDNPKGVTKRKRCLIQHLFSSASYSACFK